MAKKTDKRKLIGLVCESCTSRHYYTWKNTMNTPDKMTRKKYCPTVRAVADQVETKKNLGRNVAPKR
jgi:large subunit ribosomal protein L33